jgi:hypothetical protein
VLTAGVGLIQRPTPEHQAGEETQSSAKPSIFFFLFEFCISVAELLLQRLFTRRYDLRVLLLPRHMREAVCDMSLMLSESEIGELIDGLSGLLP